MSGRPVALIDHRRCSLAAVTRAAALCRPENPWRSRPSGVAVVLIDFRPTTWSGMAAWAAVPPVRIADLTDSIESLVFHEVAGLLAPAATPWTFHSYRDERVFRRAWAGRPEPAQIFSAPHRGLLSRLRAGLPGRAADSPGRTVVDCLHAAPGPAAPRYPGS